MAFKQFSWSGINKEGFKENGSLFATDIKTVKKVLLERYITPLKIQKQLQLPFSPAYKISHTEITEISAELSSLIASSIPLITAFNIQEENTSKPILKSLISQIKKQVENGHLLSTALKTYPHYFDEFFCSLIESGERSGNLEWVLKYIVLQREKTLTLKKKLKKALFYPAIVLMISLIVSCALLLFVIPQFVLLFQSVGAKLPFLTQCIIAIAECLRNNGLIILIGLMIIVLIIKLTNKYGCKKYYFLDQATLKIPLIGTIQKEAIFTRCFQIIAITLKAGLPLVDVLELSAKATENQIYKQGFQEIAKQIENGQTITKALENTNLFPARVIQMAHIGESSGRLDEMLQKLADYFLEQVDQKTQTLTQLLEPALMIFLCGFVGTLVIAMYLPIFRLGAVL